MDLFLLEMQFILLGTQLNIKVRDVREPLEFIYSSFKGDVSLVRYKMRTPSVISAHTCDDHKDRKCARALSIYYSETAWNLLTVLFAPVPVKTPTPTRVVVDLNAEAKDDDDDIRCILEIDVCKDYVQVIKQEVKTEIESVSAVHTTILKEEEEELQLIRRPRIN